MTELELVNDFAEPSALTACPFDTSLDAEREALYRVKQGLMPLIYGPSAKGALALWVADMDLPCCERIRLALSKRCEHPTFGYTYLPSVAWAHTARWLTEHQGWTASLDDSNFIFATSVVTAFYNLIHVFTAPADKVLVFTPLYGPLQEAIVGCKRTLVRLPLTLEAST